MSRAYGKGASRGKRLRKRSGEARAIGLAARLGRLRHSRDPFGFFSWLHGNSRTGDAYARKLCNQIRAVVIRRAELAEEPIPKRPLESDIAVRLAWTFAQPLAYLARRKGKIQAAHRDLFIGKVEETREEALGYLLEEWEREVEGIVGPLDLEDREQRLAELELQGLVPRRPQLNDLPKRPCCPMERCGGMAARAPGKDGKTGVCVSTMMRTIACIEAMGWWNVGQPPDDADDMDAAAVSSRPRGGPKTYSAWILKFAPTRDFLLNVGLIQGTKAADAAKVLRRSGLGPLVAEMCDPTAEERAKLSTARKVAQAQAPPPQGPPKKPANVPTRVAEILAAHLGEAE